MSTPKRWLFLLLVLIILILCFIGLRLHATLKPQSLATENCLSLSTGLLSPRIYSGIIKPRSYLIFNFNPLKDYLQLYIDKNNLNVSLYVVNLRDGASMSINASNGFPPASMHKVPIAILIARDIEDGKLNWTTPIPIKEAYRSDSWGSLYKTKEQQLPLRVLFEKMLQESDNTAFFALGDYIQKEDYDDLVFDYWGYLLKSGKSNEQAPLISPRSMYNVFSSLYLSTILQPNDSEYILSLLTNTSFDINAFADIPREVRIAQKFGDNYRNGLQTFNDCGIMYIQDMRLFYCVMSDGIPQERAASQVGNIVHQIYDFSIQAREYFDVQNKAFTH